MTDSRHEQGFSLVEAVVATVIAVLAVLGLAYTFSLGRGMVDRFEVGRAALGAAEDRMERLLLLNDRNPGVDSLRAGYRSIAFPFLVNGAQLGTTWWHVEAFDDPNVAGAENLRRLTVAVRWNTSVPDSVQLSQLIGRAP